MPQTIRVPLGALKPVSQSDEPNEPLRVPLSELGAMDTASPTPTPAVLPARTWTDTVADALPAVGGFVGGLVGKVPGVRVATAAVGGAAGEGYRQLAKHATEFPGAVVDVARNLYNEPAATLQGFKEGATEGAKQAAVQGGIQAAGQAGGEVLAGTAKAAAPWLMNRALNLTDKLSREFPNLSQTMIDHALTVSRGGLSQARVLLRAGKAQVNAALDLAASKGATVPITAATDGLMTTLPKVLNSADIEGGLGVLAATERKITAGRAAALTPHEADLLKQSLQTESKSLYTAEKMGTGRPNVGVQAQAKADMAASLNQAIGDITTQAGHTGYREGNAAAQEMIGAVRGITKGTRSGSNLYTAMVRPGVGAVIGGVSGGQTGGTKGAVAGTLVGGAMTSPAGMSRLAIALSKPGVQVILRGAPKLAAAVASYLAAEQGGEP